MYYFKTLSFRVIFLIGFLLSCLAGEAQVKKAFTIKDQRTLRGDMTMIANSVVNRYLPVRDEWGWVKRKKEWYWEVIGTLPEVPTSSPYNDASNNDNFTMRYIDIDGDPLTFSSSKATLAIPDAPTCSKIVYAALYWSGTYKYNESDASSGRETATFNQVKLKLPTQGAYTDVTGTIIYDDETSGSASFSNRPYACYANVTSLLAGLANPNGEYTVANIRATQASLTGGISAGWTLYIVYENPKLPGKYITSYDGFAGVSKTEAGVDLNYTGFVTVPQKVQAKLIVSALEGDKGITGDNLKFKSGPTGSFTDISNDMNPSDNFFNGTVSVLNDLGNAVNFDARTPNSLNTLGYDSDIVNISNQLLPSATEATLRITSTGDSYYMFFNAFSVDVIAPDLQLVKTVERYGQDAAGANVGLGDALDYIITFKNVGNDDGKDLVITDILPKNTIYVGTTRPAGVAPPTVNPVTGALEFIIPNALVKKGTESIESVIKIHVKVASTCAEFTDACSNEIRNRAFATYKGVVNTMTITDGSVTGLDKNNCLKPMEGPANFIVGLATCDFLHHEVLCGASLVLKTGSGYATYQWFRKDPSGDVALAGETGQQMVVTVPGEYYVKCIPAAPCLTDLLETFIVNFHSNSLQNNPVMPFKDNTAKCNDTGEVLPIIILCGLNDHKLIQTGITGVTSIVWEKLTGACYDPAAVCINKSATCTWVTVGTGPDYDANEAGTFRVRISYAGGTGCITSYYFKVTKNTLNPQVNSTNIYCAQNGEIKIVNVPTTYEIKLINQTTGAVLVDYPNTNQVFSITTPDVYRVELRHQGVADGCEFILPNIGIAKKDLEVELVATNKTCNTLGSIRIKPTDVQSQYQYSISGPVNDARPPTTDRNVIFEGLIAGVYTVNVTTINGCSFTQTVTISDFSNLGLSGTVTQNISCVPGTIKLTGTGGEPVYSYAIHSYVGTATPPPALNSYFGSSIVEVPEEQAGTYVFIMKDANGCTALTSPITISVMPGVVSTTAFTNVSCKGANDGTITYTVTATNGYAISYDLLDVDGNVLNSNTTGKFIDLAAGSYTVNLIQTGTGNVPCPFPTSFTITEPAVLAGTASLTQAFTCTTNGIITVDLLSVTGGTAPYKYSIGGAFDVANTFTGLTPGNYTVTIKDAKGCILTIPVITIPVLPKMTDLTFTPTAVTCPDVTSAVTVAVTGGAGPFQYAITAPATAVTPVGSNATFAALAPGTYTFTATDANNCTFSKDYTINAITKINVTGQLVKNVVCFSEANGSIKYTVAGSTNYNYTIVSTGTPVASATNQSASVINLNSLLAGSYTITVKDNVTNCESIATVIIAAPTATLTVSHSVVEPTCTAPGSITVTAANGWGNYKYQLNAGTVQSSNVFDNVAAGTYTITVIDANGCVKTDTATLTTPSAPVIDITGSDLCFDANGTSITVNTTGGRAPFTYTLNGGADQTEATFDDLVPGNYSITVKDGNNCVTPALVFTVYPALKLEVTQKELDCSVSPDAQINITITGGKAPFTYETKIGSNPYGSSATVATNTINYSTPDHDTYTFKITDALGCSIETNAITVLPLSMPAITSVTPTAVVCNGESNGSIAVVVDTTVGTPAYTITVRNTTLLQDFTRTTNLPAGNYTVTVTDGKGCTATKTTEIKQPAAIIFTTLETPIKCTPHPTDPTLSVTAGKIRVQAVAGGFEPVTGTPGPYTYYLKNNFGYEATPVTTSDNFYEFIILNFGIYEVTVEDANGCKLVKSNIVMASPPEEMDIDIAGVVADCTTGGTAIVEVKPIVSSNNYSFAILTTNNPNTVPASDYKPADPGTPTIHTFNGLTPGLTYTFIVKDNATGCYYIKTADIPIPTLSNLAVVKDLISNVTCTNAGDGTAKFTFSGFDAGATAVSYEVYYAQSNLPVTPVIPPALPPSVSVATGEISVSGLAPGIYFILFKEIGGIHDGCSMVSETFTISESLKLLVPTAVVTKNDNCNTKAGIITAGANHGTPPYSYELKLSGNTPPTATTWAGTTVNTFTADGGNYVVYVKDANNCIKPIAITLPTDPSPIITATLTSQCNTAEGAFSIEVDMTQAGMEPYTYSIDGGAFVNQATMPFTYTNLSSGDHTVTVKDVNGCTYSPAIPTTIYEPLNLTTVVTFQPWCGVNNGAIKVTGFGGSGAYRYELKNASDVTIAGPQILNAFSGLAPGTYKVIVRDFSSACFKEGSVTLEVPTPVTFTTTQQDVTCNGGSNGAFTILLDATNNNPDYTYAVTKGGTAVPGTGPTYTGLTAGVYNITVTSARFCDEVGVVTITEPSILTIDDVTATPFVCNPDNTVKTSLVTITATGGELPYWYSINGTDYFETNTFDVVDNNAVQNITVHVRDKNNCTITSVISIDALPVITAVAVAQVTAITCDDPETVKITVTGGSGNFKFELLPSGPSKSPGVATFTENFDLTGIGNYTFKVTDIETGCSIITAPYEVLPFNTITATVSTAVSVICHGALDGKITLDVANYSGAYSYKVLNDLNAEVGTGTSTAPNSLVITGLPAGVLHVEVTATATPFCNVTTTTITVPSPADPLVLTATPNASVTCDNDKGEIIATATGGWGTYEYQFIMKTGSTTTVVLQDYDVNSIWTGLVAGEYTINVKDVKGCVKTEVVVLVPVVRIVADILATPTLLACHGDKNAIVKATNVANGEGVYQYILNEYDSIGAVTPISSSGAQLSDTFTGLGAGIYTITVTDGWNCDIETIKVTIAEPEVLGGAISVTGELGCIAKAELTLTVTGGTAPYSYKSISDVAYTTMASDTEVINNLSDGIYQYNIIDANGCAMVMSNQITIVPVPTLELNVTNTKVNCSGATTAEIEGEAIGGLGDYKYALLADSAGNTVLVGDQNSGVFSGLGHGTYYVRVKSKDCVTTSDAIIITDPDILVATEALFDVLCFGETTGKIIINTTGGTGTKQYAISPNLSQFQDANEFTELQAGLYTVLVQDENGCFVLLKDLEIKEPELVEASIDLTETTSERCLGANDGEIAIDITGGMGSYLVNITHTAGAITADGPFIAIPGSHYVFKNLAPGDKTIFIKDTNGCAVDPPKEYTITEGIDIKPTAAVTEVCTGNTPSSTLTISIDAAITATDVEYSINGIDYQASNIFTGLVTAGVDMIAYAKHVNGCIQQALYTIETLTPIAATAATTQDVLCNAGATGEVTVTATGGTGTLEYAISDAVPPVFGAYDANNVFTGLEAGTYTISVKDAIGCEFEVTGVVVNEPALELSATAVPTHEICINANDGTIVVTPTGGTAPYYVTLDGGAEEEVLLGASHTFTALADADYTIAVRDTNNCTITDQTVTVNPGVDIQAVATPVETCTGNLPSTVVTVAVNAAVAADVEYSFDGGAYSTVNTFTYANTAGGTKTVDVKHTNGCVQRVTFDINNLTPIAATAATTQDVLCNAGATGIVTVTATGGTGTLEYAISDAVPPVFGTYDTNNVFTGLTAGTYTISVKDAIGCEFEVTGVVVNEPALELSATAVPTHEICINANDGTIVVTPTGGTAPYYVTLDGGAEEEVLLGASHTFTALADADYIIAVRDTNNCTITDQTVTVNPGVDIQAVATPVETCTGNTPSTVVTVAVNAAVAADVEYSFDGGAYSTVNTFTYANTAGGTKTVDVKHTNGCVQRVTFDINNLTPIAATAATTQDVLCNAGATGIVTVTATGGTGTLEYAISDAVPPVFGAYDTNNVFTGLTAGTYTISVKDAIGCEFEVTGVVVNEPALELSATAVPTHEICINANDGTIVVTPTGGTAPYYVTLDGGAEEEVLLGASHTFTALADADYIIAVRDTNNCTITAQTVTVNPGVDIQAVATPEETCTGNTPSTVVTVAVNAAVAADVEYSFDGGAYSTVNTFTYANTAGGTKTVDVKHTNGCVQRVTFDINNLTPIAATAATTQDVLCNAGATGIVTVTATGGTGTLEYAISDAVPPVFGAYDTNNVFTGLTAGTYTVSVKDGIGCEFEVTGVVVNEPAQALSATAVPTHEICINANDGTIVVTPIGGTAPYYVTLDGGAEEEVLLGASHTFTALADADYIIAVRDTNNCTITDQTVTVNPGVDIQAVATPEETCTGNTPSTVVTVAVNAAVAADVEYSFDGGAYSTVNTFTYANTAGGTKTVDVKHTNGCVQRVTFDINNLTPIAATAATTQDVLCNAGATGIVTVTATGGTGTLEYAISDAVPPVFGAYDTNNVFTGLTAGTYTVSVKDGIGCEFEVTGVVVNEPAQALSATAVPTHEICINANDGTIVVTPIGGTAPYYVTLDGGAEEEVLLGASHTFTALADADYIIAVRDTNNCTITDQTVTVNPGVDIQAVATPEETCTGNTPSTVVTVAVNTAVAADIEYSFDGGAYSTVNTFTYANTAGGTKTVDVKHTNGCVQRVTFDINNLTPIAATAVTTQDVLCNAGATGEVTVTATGGTGTLEYAISDAVPPVFGAYDANNVFTGLTAGTYTVSVKDGIGCEFEVTGVVVNEPALELSATAVPTHEICINANDGTITITPSGGTAPYYVTLDGGAEEEVLLGASHTFTALADADYIIAVRDTNNCTITDQTVTVNPGVDIQAVATPEETCTGNTPSTVVTVAVNAAVAADVEYSFDGGAYSTVNTFTYANTAGGTKTVDVKHTNGCIQQVPFTINNLTPVTIVTANTTENVLCYAGATGEVTVNAIGGTGTLEYAISSAVPPVFGAYDANNVFTGLTAGTYTVSVKDAIGCEVEQTNVVITQPAQMLMDTIVTTNEICINANDGTIMVTASGGTGPYFISLDGAAEISTASSHTFTSLPNDTYTIDIRDTNNCVLMQETVTINAGVDIQAVANIVEGCNANVPETVVTINVNPAVAGSVTYALDNINGTYGTTNVFTFASAAAGAHMVYVKHTNGCVQPVPFTINNLAPIGGTATATANVLCYGSTTGEVTVTAVGGTGALQYAISPNYTYQNFNVFTGLVAGTYTVKVKDAIGCEFVINSILVGGPTAALAATTVVTPETCINANDGTITITPSGGTTPYFTSIDGITYVQDKVLYDNLADGTYTVYVKDANNCAVTPQTVIIAPGVAIQPTVTITRVCDVSTVTISVNPAVAGNVTYYIDGILASSTVTQVFTPGVHTVDVEHINGCSESIPFTIAPIVPITIGTPVLNDIACYGMATGSIEVIATGGNGTLQYALYHLSDYQNGGPALYPYSTLNTFVVPAGFYVAKVRDAIGCEVISQNMEIKEPLAPITATVTAVPETCILAKDGKIQITNISGGTAPYSIALNTQTENNFVQIQGNSHEFTGLFGGNYDVFIRDANGCYIPKFTRTVKNGVNMQPYVTTAVSCNNNIQTTTVTVQVIGTPINEVTFSETGNPGTYTTNNVFSYTVPGDYIVYVLHNNGCKASVKFTVAPRVPIVPTATSTAVLCKGEATGTITVSATGGAGALQYGIAPNYNMTSNPVFNGLVAGDHIIRVQDVAGCYTDLTVNVKEPATALAVQLEKVWEEICIDDNNGALEVSVSGGTAPYFTSLDANGIFTEGEYIYDNLDGGVTYTVYVKDANGCTTSIDVPLAAPITINAREEIVYECNGNTVKIKTTDVFLPTDLTYSLNGGAPQTSNEFKGLPNGEYTVEVLHVSGCSDSVTFKVNNPLPLTVTLTETGFNQITATASGGSGSHSYSITFNGEEVTTNRTFTYFKSGTYEVLVTDSRGCEAKASINVVFVEINIPDIATPDNDGHNDGWKPNNTLNYPNLTADVFDRYGRKLATLREGQAWDCRYEGNEMPSGDYWYLIKLNADHDSREFIGHFTIYR